MASMIDSKLFNTMFSTPELSKEFDDRTIVQNWFDIEKALAQTQAAYGIIPKEAAAEISKRADASLVDLDELGKGVAAVGHPFIPALRALEHLCENGYGEYLHLGATTQDISDTGFIMSMKRAFKIIYNDLRDVEEAGLVLAEKYRDTVMVGRTHGQQGLPITFGYKVAIWVSELRRIIERMKEVYARDFVGQLSGAVGTMAGFGDKGEIISNETIAKLGLDIPDIAWHSSRDRIASILNVLSIAAYSLCHIGHECACMMKTEFGEVTEGFVKGMVGSTTMPHKRNPGLSEISQALARLAKASADASMNSMVSEHERDAAVWRVEWRGITECFIATGTAAVKAKKLLAGLNVNEKRMRQNLELTKGLLYSEPIMFLLGEKLGKQTAHEIVYEICMDCFEKDACFIDELMANATVAKNVTREQLEAVMDPEKYTGKSGYFVDQVVANTKAARAKDAI